VEVSDVKELCERIKANISKVIVGKEDVIHLVLTALLSSGHVLLEDVPGVGKTMLAKCLAKSIDCSFSRIQFTPDLLPSDITGINYYNQKECEFEFRPGPVFTNILLADEINRATPRTQSSLLECMEEKQVTIDGETKSLSKPFLVIATQNPVEIQGTFPLPEAQLDRFLVKLKIGYPLIEESRKMLDRFQEGSPFETIDCVANKEEILEAQNTIDKIKISATVKDYIVDIVEETRNFENITLGVSPRGCIALMKASQAYAALKGRDFVTPDDVKYMAVPVLAHRIILRGYAMQEETKASETAILQILDKVKVPLEDF
jgi:MoxR-like ATPase